MTEQADIAIVGGGPVGASLALALAASGLSVTLLEASADIPADPRALALSYGTRQILRQLGAWLPDEAATPIDTVHISQQGGFGRAELSAQESGIPALGYVADYPDLARTLRQKLAGAPVRFLSGTEVTAATASGEAAAISYVHDGKACALAAKLLVLADGGRSLGDLPGMKPSVRDYRQCALLARVKTDQPHRNRAFERFSTRGPVALLPSGGEWALVWTVAAEEAEILNALDDTAFLAALQQRFGQRAGCFTGVRERGSFPLALKQTRPVTGPRWAVIGNAAQVLHPFAGQGFNLGVRDAMELAAEIRAVAPEAIGSPAMLARYRARRRADTRGGIAFTDSILRLFEIGMPAVEWGRGLGLAALDVAAPLKQFVLRRLIYGSR